MPAWDLSERRVKGVGLSSKRMKLGYNIQYVPHSTEGTQNTSQRLLMQFPTGQEPDFSRTYYILDSTDLYSSSAEPSQIFSALSPGSKSFQTPAITSRPGRRRPPKLPSTSAWHASSATGCGIFSFGLSVYKADKVPVNPTPVALQ